MRRITKWSGLFVFRAEAESATLGELLLRYLAEITPSNKGAGPESARVQSLRRHPLANRYVAGIRGVDIARYRDGRLKKVSSATVKRDLVIVSHLFETARKEWGIQVHNPVRDIKSPPHSRARDRRLQPGPNGEEGEENGLLEACPEARNPFLLPIVRLALEPQLGRRLEPAAPGPVHGSDGRGLPAWTACRGGVAVRADVLLRS